MIVLNRCDFRSAEVNIATNYFNNHLSFSNHKRHETKHKSVYTLLNNFSGKYGFTNSHLNSGRSDRLQSEKQDGSKNIPNTKKIINVSTLSYPSTGTMVDTRGVVNHNEFRQRNLSKGESPYFLKLVKKSIKPVLRNVPFGHSWGKYVEQTPYVMSRPSSIAMEPITISITPVVQHTVAPTIHTAIKSSTVGTVLTSKNMLKKQLRKKFGVRSAIPLDVRFGNRNYVVTREVTKKENNNMLPILLKPCTKYNLIKCPYGEIKMTNHEVTSLVPSMSIVTTGKSTTSGIGTTESSPIETIYMYILSSETSTIKLFNEISAINLSETNFPVTSMKPTSPAMNSMITSHIVDIPILNTNRQQRRKTILQTANALNGWPMFSPYFNSRTDKLEIKLLEDEVKVQEGTINAQEVEKDRTNFRKGLVDYASFHDWSEDRFATGGSQETEVEQILHS